VSLCCTGHRRADLNLRCRNHEVAPQAGQASEVRGLRVGQCAVRQTRTLPLARHRTRVLPRVKDRPRADSTSSFLSPHLELLE
jgi:hypothetical protein